MVTGDKLTAQAGVLGSLLIEPKLLGEALTRVREEDFLSPAYRMLFQAMRELFQAGREADPVSIRDRLGWDGSTDWSAVMLGLMEQTPTAANIWMYADLMREQAALARAAELGEKLQAAGSMAEAEGVIAQLNGLLVGRTGVRRMDMEQMLANFYERHAAQTPRQYVPWPLEKLSQVLYIEPGDYVVLGGYPSAGKTALAVSCAYRQAETRRVGFYSLETSQYKLADRLMSNLMAISMGSLKRGEIGAQEWAYIAKKSGEVRGHTMTLIDASGMSAGDIQADALAHRYQAVYADYLQIVRPEQERVNRTEQVSAISRTFQRLAHRHGVLVTVLSQLTRGEEQKGGKKREPVMSDLRESGQIEQDADAVLLLFLEDPDRPAGRRILKLGKNKEGEQGRIYLQFDGAYQRFRESALDAPAPAPSRRWAPRREQVHFSDLPPNGDDVPF